MLNLKNNKTLYLVESIIGIIFLAVIVLMVYNFQKSNGQENILDEQKRIELNQTLGSINPEINK